jgi:hypothetical protein
VKPFATRDVKFSLRSFTDRLTTTKPGTVNAIILVGSKDHAMRSAAPGLMENYLTPEQKTLWRKMSAEQRAPVIEKALPLMFADQIIATETTIGAALVVDLSNGQGDAKIIYEAFRTVMPTGSKLAYWNPQVLLNIEPKEDPKR